MVRIEPESSIGFMIRTCDLNQNHWNDMIDLIHRKVERHAEISRANIRVHNIDDDV